MHRLAIFAAALLTLPFTALAGDEAVVPEVFSTKDPNRPEFIRYADAVRVGDMLYVSGVSGTPVERDADEAALTANFVGMFEQVKATLARAGATFDNVVTIETHRLDFVRTFAPFNEVKNRYIKAPYPAWTDIGVSALVPGAVAELTVTAWLGGTRQEAADAPAATEVGSTEGTETGTPAAEAAAGDRDEEKPPALD